MVALQLPCLKRGYLASVVPAGPGGVEEVVLSLGREAGVEIVFLVELG